MGLSTSFGVLSGMAATFKNAVPFHQRGRHCDPDWRGFEMLILAWWNQCRQPDRYDNGNLDKAKRMAIAREQILPTESL
jgi:hypothetical protein